MDEKNNGREYMINVAKGSIFSILLLLPRNLYDLNSNDMYTPAFIKSAMDMPMITEIAVRKINNSAMGIIYDDTLTKRYPREYTLYCFKPRIMDENIFMSMAPDMAMPDILMKVV